MADAPRPPACPDTAGGPPARPARAERALGIVPLRRPEDFRRLLQRRPLARHAGWSLHGEQAAPAELSTLGQSRVSSGVDDTCPPVLRIGVVLSRRHVRRAVTRNLMRRLWRALLAATPAARLAGWSLVLRRTAAWDRTAFPSASSDALRRRLREDLGALLLSALRAMPSRAAAPVQP